MKLNIKYLLSNTLLPAWLILVATLFALANRASYLHAFIFPNWHDFSLASLQISFGNYIFDIFFSLLGLIVFLIACMGIGLATLQRLNISSRSHLALGATSFVVGEIIFSALFLSIISLTRLNPAITGAIIGFSILMSIALLKNFFSGYYQYLRSKILDTGKKKILFLILGLLSFSLVLSSARLGYDAVSDYFSQAKLMAASQEASSFFPENYMIVSSLHPDILFTVIMQLFGDQSARMLSWLNGLAILIIGYVIAEENGIPLNARLYFFVLMLSSTAFTDLLGDGKVELICTAPIVVSVYWMMHSLKTPSKGVFLLIGLLAGFAIISRLYNIFLVSLFTAVFYIYRLGKVILTEKQAGNTSTWKVASIYIKPILWIFPTLILMGVFHLWQNQVWLGSPFAPLEFAQKLEATNWEWQFDPKMLNLYRVFYPLVVTIFNSPQSLGNISPLFIGFLPFLLLKDLRKKMKFSQDLTHILVTSISTLLIWVAFFYTIVEVRYVMFIWVLLFLPTGMLIDFSFDLKSKVVFSTSRLMIILLLLFISLRIFLIAVITYSPIDENGQAHCRDIGFCTFFDAINKIASPGDRVFSLNAYRYYLRNDLFVCSSRANEYANLQELAQKNSPEFWVELYRQGYNFVAYEDNFSVFHSRFGTIPDPQIAPPWLRINIISSSNKNHAYHIQADSPPFQPDISCQKNTQNVWYLATSE